jgi:hypothetical protein
MDSAEEKSATATRLEVIANEVSLGFRAMASTRICSLMLHEAWALGTAETAH